jgi:hypothetical protein
MIRATPRGNTVHVRLAPGVPALRARAADRALFASSSCGVCGKASIDRVIMKHEPLPMFQPPPVEVVLGMPATLRAAQPRFDATGGLHAAGLFHLDGRLELAREDVGRHNAVDKVIGARLRAEACPIPDRLLVVSGRVGMEIVQKALVARIPGIVSVGAAEQPRRRAGRRRRHVLGRFCARGAPQPLRPGLRARDSKRGGPAGQARRAGCCAGSLRSVARLRPATRCAAAPPPAAGAALGAKGAPEGPPELRRAGST